MTTREGRGSLGLHIGVPSSELAAVESASVQDLRANSIASSSSNSTGGDGRASTDGSTSAA